MNTEIKKVTFFRSMRGKLILWFLLLALIPLSVVGGLAYWQAQNALRQAAFDKLEAIRTIKSNQLQLYLSNVQQDTNSLANTINTFHQQTVDQLDAVIKLKETQVKDLVKKWHDDALDRSSDVVIVTSLAELSADFANLGASQVRSLDLEKDGSAYSIAYRKVQKDNMDDLNVHGYEDVLLIDPSGNVVYSAKKGQFLGANLASDDYKGSNLAELYQQLKEATDGQVYIADAALYGGNIAMYVGSAVYSGTVHLGTFVYHVPFKQINGIMQERTGMGKTGESFLVGPDKRMRTDSFLDSVNRSVSASFSGTIEKNGIDTPAVRAALSGQRGINVLLDYRAEHCLVDYSPFNAFGLNWVIIAKKDVAESIAMQVEEQTDDFFSLFAKERGYHDILLATRDGYLFYTLAHEADYKTNVVNGLYKDTHLGQLVQQVINKGKFGLTDLIPYQPSGNAPAAFVASPVAYKGQVEFVAVVQLPIDKINQIMQERTGMGETGESILVGPDKRMRSDSFLDKTTHSVEASFAGTVENNGADTTIVAEALAGKTGVELYTTYLGTPGIGVYSPFNFEGLHWAIMAKQDQSEAFAPVNQLMAIILVVIGSVTLPVIIIALWVANTLVRPIVNMAAVARAVAEGNLKVSVPIISSDETAILANDVNQMIANLRDLIGQVQRSAGQVANASQQLNVATEQVAEASQQVSTIIQQIAQGTNQQSRSLAQATSNTDQISRAADGVARGSQDQAQSIQKTSALVNQTVDIIKHVGQIASLVTGANAKVTQAAQHGVVSVEQTGQGMENIRARAIVTADKVKEMNKRAKEIGRIVDTIDDIADKTDMLALNAAVEAARAGEFGRGFAVVADHVRKLSEDSKVATRDISELIERMQETVNESIAAMESTTLEVDNGTRLTEETTRSLQEIMKVAEEAVKSAERINEAVTQLKEKSEGVVVAIESVSAVVEENTAAAEEMAANSQEVTATMEGIASVSEENSAAAEEVSASAEEMLAQVEEITASSQELANLAGQLRAAVAKFQV